MNEFKEKIKKMTPLEGAAVFHEKHPEFFDKNKDTKSALEKSNYKKLVEKNIERELGE